MKTSFLRIRMPDNSLWDVPAILIASNLAKHYERDGSEAYEIEKANALASATDLIDWAANNMNWSDVEKFAQKVQDGEETVDYQEGWVNGAKQVIEKESP